MIVTAGLAAVSSYLSTNFTWIGIGDSNTAEAMAQTALVSQVETRGQDGTPEQYTTNYTNDSARINYTFTMTGSRTLKESGLFTAVSGGTMFARKVFSDINLSSGESITMTWQIVVS